MVVRDSTNAYADDITAFLNALNNGCLAVLPYGWTFLDECIDALLGIIGQHVVDHDFKGESHASGRVISA